MVGNVLVFDPDLLFSSRIEAACRKHGLQVKIATSLEELQLQLKESFPQALIANLDVLKNLEKLPIMSLRGSCRLIGYYSHMDSDLAKDALDSGFEMVVPRRGFMDKLSNILAGTGSS